MIEAATLWNTGLPLCVFLSVYALITFDLVDKAIAVLTGVAILAITQTSTLHEMLTFVDIDTIGLLFGMMIIVTVISRTGLLRLISYHIAKLTKGSPMKILLLFGVTTAIFSAFLDNVTTILIMVPLTIELTLGLGLDPRLFVISEAILSNIGGASTLIGDPPNIMIGSATGLSFNQFIVNLAIPVLSTIIVFCLYLALTHKKSLRPVNRDLKKLFSIELLFEKIKFDLEHTKFNKRYITKSVVVLAIVILFFILEPFTHIPPSVIAISGGLVLFFITKTKFEIILEKIEWNTLLFFSGLFMLVGVLEKVGIIEVIARKLIDVAGSNPYLIVLVILWATGIISGFLDNIPLTAAMIPVIMSFTKSVHIPGHLIWWALALGASFGGNITMIGSSANVISANMLEKKNEHISFLDFFKIGFPTFLISMTISSVYLLYRVWSAS